MADLLPVSAYPEFVAARWRSAHGAGDDVGQLWHLGGAVAFGRWEPDSLGQLGLLRRVVYVRDARGAGSRMARRGQWGRGHRGSGTSAQVGPCSPWLLPCSASPPVSFTCRCRSEVRSLGRGRRCSWCSAARPSNHRPPFGRCPGARPSGWGRGPTACTSFMRRSCSSSISTFSRRGTVADRADGDQPGRVSPDLCRRRERVLLARREAVSPVEPRRDVIDARRLI